MGRVLTACRRVAALMLCLSAVAVSRGEEAKPAPPPAREEPARPPSEEDFRRWVRDLGTDRFETREAAMDKLVAAGEGALPYLQAANMDDPEVSTRVAQLFEGRRREIVGCLERLVILEASWRAGDLDRNGAHDYWTRDLAAFHAVHDASGAPVSYLPLAWARADAAPARAYPELAGRTAPYKGYLFKALRTDPDGRPYVQPGAPGPAAGNAPRGPCTHPAGFAFCAWPARYGVDGVRTYLVSETAVVFETDLGPDAKGVETWPHPEDPKNGWKRIGE